MDRPAELTSFAATRFSPMRFDPHHQVTGRQVETLLRAAGRAPSAGNAQPWAFVAGRRGDQVHARLVRHLARSSASWAPQAGLLLANLSQQLVEGTDREFGVPPHWEVTTMAAVGLPAAGAASYPGTTRERRPLAEIVWPARPATEHAATAPGA
ncbi:MAG: nitroreductase family protein [Nocardioides sp.]|uniref:nitroreductase family protein n=1 Tax=Nocardioides sp. TaxID=35761 RepID=UPI0039E5149D